MKNAFQFHKGTIRTATLEVIHTKFLDFNSIKVQLELLLLFPVLPLMINFNSIKVQLEHINPQVNSNLADISIP